VWYGWELLYPRPSFLHCPSLTLLLDYNVPEMPPRFSKAVCVSLVIVPVLIQLASAADFDWKSLIPQIRKVLNQTFPGEGIEEHYNIAIYGTGDVTGDGIPEAIVYVGTGGASTDEVVLMRLESGSPVVAKFRGKNGTIQTPTFLRGASVTHSDDFELVPEKHAVYSMSSMTDSEGRLAKCGVIAYRWNPSSKTYDWNKVLSAQLKQKVCPKVGSPGPA